MRLESDMDALTKFLNGRGCVTPGTYGQAMLRALWSAAQADAGRTADQAPDTGDVEKSVDQFLAEVREEVGVAPRFHEWLRDRVRALLSPVVAERDRLQQWVHDLQAGMFINCVYCGHRYGPDDEVPATMADALKEHVERCPKHPMAKMREERDAAESARKDAEERARTLLQEYGDHKAGCASQSWTDDDGVCYEAGACDCGFDRALAPERADSGGDDA